VEEYQHRRHNKNLLMVHLILVTKYRKSLFSGALREDVKQIIFDICAEHHWYVRRMETDKDHIHILLQYSPNDSVSNIVSVIKQYSTHRMWGKHSKILGQHYWKHKCLWSGGYFAASVGNASQETIKHYIENQG
jgi:putative transposase